MEKYIVIVNHKYLVSVEAASHGGAEHRCLDLHYGIEYAQAFSRDDLRTEFFRDNAIGCETISFAELVAKSEAYKDLVDRENEARQTLKDNEARIAKLLSEIDLLNSNNSILRYNIQALTNERAQII